MQNKIKFSLSIVIVFVILIGCKDKGNYTEYLFNADALSKLNSYNSEEIDNKLENYYLADSERKKDPIKDLQFKYSAHLYFKYKSIDSLYGKVFIVFWEDYYSKNLDTMAYRYSGSIVDPSKNVGIHQINQIRSMGLFLLDLQKKIIALRLEVEKLRPGAKAEQIVCQNCALIDPKAEVNNVKNMAELYYKTEKLILQCYRELRCALKAIELINKKKIVDRHYKIRR
jgi:hypothetical protein